MGVRAFEASQVRAVPKPNAGDKDAHRRPLLILLGDDRKPGQRDCTDDRDSDQKDSAVANHVSSPNYHHQPLRHTCLDYAG